MKRLNELFEVSYGNKFDMNKMTHLPRKEGGVNFISRTGNKNGVSGAVARLENVKPYDAGVITVALGGEKLLSSFVQESPFYTAQNVAVLTPLEPITFAEKVFVCQCIRHNRFRYSAFGREANRTLRDLAIPDRDDFPNWLTAIEAGAKGVAENVATSFEQLQLADDVGSIVTFEWKTVDDLFDVKYGNSYELLNMRQDSSGVNFVSRRMGNNSVSAKVRKTKDEPFAAGNLSVALGGNGVLETCVQPSPFYTGRDVAVLIPRTPMSLAQKLFCCIAIKHNKFRFGFGRQANRTLSTLHIPPLPTWVNDSSVENVKSMISVEIRGMFAST